MANSVERYYQKKKRRKKRAKVVFFTLLFILMMLTLAILSVTVFFNAETILVEGNTHYSAEEMLEVGGLKVGQNLFRLDKFEVIDKMQELPYVKTVTIKRRLPNTLNVKVQENEPVVWLPAGNQAALLNEEYRVLELVELPAEIAQAIRAEDAARKEAEEKEKNDEQTEEPADQEKPGEMEVPEEPEESAEPEAPEESEESTEPEDTEEAEEFLPGVPRLVGVNATELQVGKTALFGEEDYTGFLQRLYEGFAETEDLDWKDVGLVQFHARYDIKLLYKEHVTIDFGTLDQVSTKLELAVYLINDNGTSQTATVDVSDTERVYYRPKK